MQDQNWDIRLAHQCMSYIMRLNVIMGTFADRAAQIIDDARTAAVLYRAHRWDPMSEQSETEPAEPALTAREELDHVAYILAGLILTGSYCALEDFIRELVTTKLDLDPDARHQRELTGNLRKSVISRLPSMTSGQIYDALALSAKNKRGMARFEALLSSIGYGGKTDPADSAMMMELGEIRHKFSHSMGRADAKFLDLVPDTPFSTGDLIRVPEPRFREYLDVVHAYVYEILERIRIAHHLSRLWESDPVTSRDWVKWRPDGA